MRGFRIPPPLVRRLTVEVGVVSWMVLTGPFGTFDDLNFAWRLFYWSMSIFGCGMLVYSCASFLLRNVILDGWPKVPRLGLAAMIAALPGGALISVLERWIRDNPAAYDHYFWFWFCVAVIGFLVATIHFLVIPLIIRDDGPAAQDNVSFSGDVSFFSRLPQHLGRDLVSLTMQDHYVHVTTLQGTAMVLLRFADALKELAGYPGVQVHRSHWVANGKATAIVRQKGRTFIQLVDGRLLPVSRTFEDGARSLIKEEEPDIDP